MNAFPIVRAAVLAAAVTPLLSCSRQADRPPDPNAPPVDVASFMARRDGCDALLRYRPSPGEDLSDLRREMGSDGISHQYAADSLQTGLWRLRRDANRLMIELEEAKEHKAKIMAARAQATDQAPLAA